MTKRFLSIMALAMMAACGSPPPRLPFALERAQTVDQDARRALRMGDAKNARILFSQSLTLHQSVDDVDGAASALISLATVSHQMHDDEVAIRLLDQILLDRAGIYPPEWRATAAFRKAVILADTGRTDEASSVLSSADTLCERDCPLRSGIDVLKARLALLKGDAAAALELAQSVASAQGTGKEERANALRIVAAAEEKLIRLEEASLHYRAALELDKSLALSGRIEEDLNGMARVSAHLGRAEEAAGYARRAIVVHDAARKNAPATIPAAP
ncbi:MAG TPA: hypothetical protein VFP33_02505 [Gallionella sp.]|nr:hypothetical protein [Gallionella sp.]